jgi:hypothetical protein
MRSGPTMPATSIGSLLVFFASTFLLAAMASECRAQTAWRGVIPLQSTRADVERILGKPESSERDKSSYRLGKDRVRVRFSVGAAESLDCLRALPEGTVVYVRVVPKRAARETVTRRLFPNLQPLSRDTKRDGVYADVAAGVAVAISGGRARWVVFLGSAGFRDPCLGLYHRFILGIEDSYLGLDEEPLGHPAIMCLEIGADPNEVPAGGLMALRVTAIDPEDDLLTYKYWASGGQIVGTGPRVEWNSAGLAPGTYTITVQVEDGYGSAVDCSIQVRVLPEKPVDPGQLDALLEPDILSPQL